MEKSIYYDISLTGTNLTDVEVIKQSISNILNTRKGERFFNRDFGSRIEDLLFEPFDFSVTRSILSEVTSVLNRWEKRVEILAETDVKLLFDSRKYELNLYVRLRDTGLNLEYNQIFDSKNND